MTHYAIGNIEAAEYDYEDAAEAFRRGAELAPGDPLMWEALAWTLTYVQPPRATEAEAAARRAIELQPTFDYAYYQLGRSLMQQQRYEASEEAFRQMLTLNPETSAARLGLAQVAIARGDYDLAEAELERHSDPRSPLVLVQVARLHTVRGEREEALTALERAVEADYRDRDYLVTVDELDPLRDHPRFQALLERLPDS